MDRATLIKMKKAQEIAEKNAEKAKLESNHENIEFWEKGLETLKENKKNLLNTLAETNFLIDCYDQKINNKN